MWVLFKRITIKTNFNTSDKSYNYAIKIYANISLTRFNYITISRHRSGYSCDFIKNYFYYFMTSNILTTWYRRKRRRLRRRLQREHSGDVRGAAERVAAATDGDAQRTRRRRRLTRRLPAQPHCQYTAASQLF